jgi:hypothetical protein
MNVPRVALVVAPSLATAAAVVTDGRWLERVAWPGVPVTLALFWSATLATLATAFLIRRYAKWCALSLAVSALALYFASPAALAWTAWSINGFAP